MKGDGAILTQLLAVKQYCPREEVNDARVGECVRLWSGQVLEEWGFGWNHVLGAVTDSGSGVKFAFGNTPGIFREWCIPRLLNRAIIDAFGLSLSPAMSKNPQSRGIFGDMQKDIERARKSTDDNVSCFGARFHSYCYCTFANKLIVGKLSLQNPDGVE